jgi:hypothetical protein
MVISMLLQRLSIGCIERRMKYSESFGFVYIARRVVLSSDIYLRYLELR